MSMLTVIYEETCGFCNWCRRFVEKRARVDIDFIGYDSVEAHKLLASFPALAAKRTQTIIVFGPTPEPTTKFRACREVALHMRRPWPFIARLLSIVPVFIGDLGYDLVAFLRPYLSKLVAGK